MHSTHVIPLLILYALPTESSDGESSDEPDLLTESDSVDTVHVMKELSQSYTVASSKLKLLLFKSIFFIGGIALLVAGGVASQYHPPVDYSNCTQIVTMNQSLY